jgi:hypothetical protein
MRTRSKTLIAGAVCLIVAALGVRLSRTAKVPAYNGRLLGDWFHELPVTSIRPGLVMTAQSVTLLGRTYGNSQVQPKESLSALPESAVERLRKLSSNTNSSIGATAAYILNAQTEQHLKDLIGRYQ